MFWWGLAVFVLMIPALFYGIYRWASSDPSIEREIAKERFRAEQELRWLRRSTENASTPTRKYK
jgi:hypothetical protein